MKNTSNLNHLAVLDQDSKGRLITEDTSRTRSEFQRDRDRIIHSSAFRRLKHKTQVFVSHEGDHYRTRLTHSLEVAQIARSISRYFNLNETHTEALALAHDIGHPPFGHAGEDTLKILMSKNDGFDHNDQAIRIVHTLEKKYFDFDGLNLTWETLEGLVKHNGPLLKVLPLSIKSLNAEFDLRLEEFSSLEAQIAAIADDIAYNNHDIDDGYRSGVIKFETLMDVSLFKECADLVKNEYHDIDEFKWLHETIRRIMHKLIFDICETSTINLEKFKPKTIYEIRNLPNLIGLSKDMAKKQLELKQFLRAFLYEHERVLEMTDNAKEIIKDLFAYFIDEPTLLPESYQNISKNDLPRSVADYIAGMTDRYAIKTHKENIK